MSVLQQLNQPELNWPVSVPTVSAERPGRSETPAASRPPESPTGELQLMEMILELSFLALPRAILRSACQRSRRGLCFRP